MLTGHVRFHYEDYTTVRDLMNEINDNEDLEDRLSDQELRTLAKTNEIIAAMEKKRADEDAGIIPRTKMVFRKGKRVKIVLGTQEKTCAAK